MGSIPHEQLKKSVQNAINSILEEAVAQDGFLGLSYIAVDRQGDTIYSGAHGHQTFAKDTPMTVDTAGWMASMTKVMTSIAVMQVVERGLIGLDDDLATLVPEFGNIQVLAAFDQETQVPKFEMPVGQITLRRLLSHSSGFTYDQDSEDLLAWTKATGKDKDSFCGEWRAWIRPLTFNPGTAWKYGPGVDWAGKVVELLTKQSLEEYMSENIWSRVGMTNTTFFPLQRPDMVHLDMGTRLQGPTEDVTPGKVPWPVPVKDCMGGCGVYSTVADYAKLLASINSVEETQLKNRTTDEFFAPQLSEGSKKGLALARSRGGAQIDIPVEIPVDHGLGGLLVTSDIPGRRKKGSMCWDGMSNPQWFMDRTSGITCVFFTQILPCPDRATKKLWAKLEETLYRLYVDKVK